MNLHSIKTDNAFLSEKINVRKEALKHLKTDEIRVLDLFAGENKLWSFFKTDYYFGVEKEKNKGKNLYANNKKVIPHLDLSVFNVIDLDSYGIPVDQVSLIFENKTLKKGTVIIYTCIGNSMSMLPKKLIDGYNLGKIYKKCKVLLNDKSQELFYGYLYKNGVRKVFEVEKKQNFIKKYGFFIV